MRKQFLLLLTCALLLGCVQHAPQARPPMTHAAKLAEVQQKAKRLAVGMTRADVEQLFRERDGGLQGATTTRYYEEPEVVLEVPFDQTGGNWSPANRVSGPPKIYRSPRHFD
jgi:hypothetical protein